MRKLSAKTVLLLGTGRSGTTWIANLLSRPFRYRQLFEPFHPTHFSKAIAVADRYYRDIPSPVVADYCFRALDDRLRDTWILQNTGKRLGLHYLRRWPKVRILKEVRANLFIPAFYKMFGPDLPMIAVVRHPYEVIASFLRVKFPWGGDVFTLLSQSCLQADFNIPLDKLRCYTNTLTGRIAIRWAVENSFILNYAAAYGVHIYFYEQVKSDPEKHIADMCQKSGIKMAPDIAFHAEALSNTTHSRSPMRNGSEENGLGAEDKQLIDEIISLCNIQYPEGTFSCAESAD